MQHAFGLVVAFFLLGASSGNAADGFDSTTGPLPVGAGGKAALWVWPADSGSPLPGNVGIGTGLAAKPAANLEVKRDVRLGMDEHHTSQAPACGVAQKGTLSFDTVTKTTLYFCTGTTWNSIPAK